MRILIIGAGFAGLGAAVMLKRAGFEHITVLDRGASVGGVWRDNSYPGCACDVPSHLYSFSFDPHFEWDRPHARQDQILAYLDHIADKHGVRPHLRLNTEVRSAAWLEDRRIWQLRINDHELLEGEVLISGVGGLVKPKWPAIEGWDEFKGPVFHSARWRHDLDLSTQRVALIGTGASAVQIAPELARTVQHLHVFQRTPPWVLPRRDRPYGRWRRTLYRHVPGLLRLNRWRVYWLHEFYTWGFLGNRWLEGLMAALARAHLQQQVPDAGLRARLRPHDLPGCKRLLMSSTWYPTLCQPQVTLVDQAAARITAEGVITGDGQLHLVDVIILGTGFSVTGGLGRTQGRRGLELGPLWAQSAQTYLGLVTHGFPNMFTLMGPGTGLGSNSGLFMLEAQLHYVTQAVRYLSEHKVAIDIKAEVQQASYDRIQQRFKPTVWASGCKSWYQSGLGRIDTLWPDFSFNYWRRTRRFDPALYDLS